jgi:hypothetical protein
VSELHFEIAAADEKAVTDREYFLTVFDLPGPAEGDPKEKYAAVRPAPDAWLALSRTVYVAKRSQEDMLVSGLKFLDQAFIEKDIRKALLQAIDRDPDKYKAFRPTDGDMLNDPDLSDLGVEVSRSNQRLTDRLFDGDDRFGSSTLVGVMESLTEQWSGNPTGSPQDSSSSPRRAGARSTGSASPKASTSSRSSAARRRAS